MATSVSTTFHGYAAGKTFTPADLRSGMMSRVGVVQDGATANKARPGILPGFVSSGGSNPLDVKQASTPAMKVKVFAGTVIQVTADVPGGVYTHTLSADTELDIGTAPGANSRYDMVVAKVVDSGSAPVTTIEVLQGAAAASPALPTAFTTPAGNTYYFPLARVTVAAGVSTIVNANIVKPAAAGGVPTFGQLTVGPGAHVPVANLTDAATLPPYTPFYSIADKSTGMVVSAGSARLDGHQHRYMYANGGVAGTTNANGDLSLAHGLFLNGVFTAAPFPTGCFGSMLGDALGFGTWDAPIVWKNQGSSGPPTAANSGFRAYTIISGTWQKMTNAAVVAYGIAWGW